MPAKYEPAATTPKPRLSFSELAERRSRCQKLKAQGLPCPDDPVVREPLIKASSSINQKSWAYGLTTIPQRLTGTLPSTLRSLDLAGFPDPWLFIDGACKLPEYLRRYQTTIRSSPVRVAGNWVLGLWEVYSRKPHADMYAMFQDDFLTYPNLRLYLEHCPYPERGYWNLLTFLDNEGVVKNGKVGWYEAGLAQSRNNVKKKQTGRGAVALVFSRVIVQELLSRRGFIDRFMHPTKGWKRIDAAIADNLNDLGIREYIHNPSLVQHIGLQTSMMDEEGKPIKAWRPGQEAKTFRGEGFNALQLIAADQ